MANELGAGNGSGYPASLDTDDTQEANTGSPGATTARAEVVNDLADAVIKIETELGVNPAGSLTDVVTFIQTEHTTSGTHKLPVTAKTDNYTLTAADTMVTFNGANKTATLPAAASNTGKLYIIKNLHTTSLTVDGNGSETIDGTVTRSLDSQNSYIWIVSDGTNWIIIGYEGIIY